MLLFIYFTLIYYVFLFYRILQFIIHSLYSPIHQSFIYYLYYKCYTGIII